LFERRVDPDGDGFTSTASGSPNVLFEPRDGAGGDGFSSQASGSPNVLFEQPRRDAGQRERAERVERGERDGDRLRPGGSDVDHAAAAVDSPIGFSPEVTEVVAGWSGVPDSALDLDHSRVDPAEVAEFDGDLDL
jgi:hypothetical protein